MIQSETLLRSLPTAAARELQDRLCRLGLLDPVVGGDVAQPFRPVATGDGQPGAETRTALHEFCKLAEGAVGYQDGLVTPDIWRLLDRAVPDVFLPINFEPLATDGPQTRLAKRILKHLSDKGFWIARSPNARNIVYVEGLDGDGSPNADRFNEWNDRRMVISVVNGEPRMLINDQATSEPGNQLAGPVNPAGVARVAFGQYKAWQMGIHGHGAGHFSHAALVQHGPLRIHRDLNRDGNRTGDRIEIGRNNYINQHSTRPGTPPEWVNRYSAGCMVGRRFGWHESFLSVVKTDFRFVSNQNYVFMATVVAGNEVA